MFYWKVHQRAQAKARPPAFNGRHCGAPAAPRLFSPLFTGTHLRSSSTAISCLTWWNSFAILQCSLYTWTLSSSDTQGGTGCSREQQRGCTKTQKYTATWCFCLFVCYLKEKRKWTVTFGRGKLNLFPQTLLRHWYARLPRFVLARNTCLLISVTVIRVLFYNTIGVWIWKISDME